MNPTFEREVRLGLVLYGGVSLAIYINGVAQEFFNAVKGRGVYRLIKALTDSDIVVDIVSGSSAGGINGVLLSYALANDLDFPSCATLWREHADIQRMLRSVTAPRPPSVLDSEGYFQHHLENIYATMPAYSRQPGDERWESVTEGLDLSVTGTDYDGELTTHFDSLGHPIVVKDHRKVFKLKYRRRRSLDQPPGTGNDFAKGGRGRIRALATLSRITATFPAAFAPVEVPAQSTLPTDAVDREAMTLLHTWGGFGNETTWFLDGGVLDNKPFTYTIRDIYYRASERRVERKLFYVEPDPERFALTRRAVAPDLLQVVVAALVGIPGYESIADDLRAIDDRNARLQRYNEIATQVRQEVLGATTPPSETQLEQLHRQSRVGAIRDGFLQHLLSARKGVSLDAGQKESVRRLAGRLVEFFAAWPATRQQQLLDAFDSGFLTRRLFHVTYYLYDVLYPAQPGQEAGAGAQRRHRNLLYALNRQIQVVKVVEHMVGRLQDEMRLFGDKAPAAAAPPPGDERHVAGALWGETRGLLLALLTTSGVRPVGAEELPALARWLGGVDGAMPPLDEEWDRWTPPGPGARPEEGWLSDRVVGDLVKELDRRVRALTPHAHELHRALEGRQPAPSVDVLDPAAPTIIEALEGRSREILLWFRQNRPPEAVDRVYERFSAIDAHLFPLEYLSDLQEKDPIEIVRISPMDAARGFCRNRLPADKIAGDALYHFGGFFKRSWRSNDILWGRLDTVNLLLESLLTPERVARLVGTAAGRERIRTFLRQNPADEVAALFPHAAANAKDAVARWLGALLAEPTNPGDPSDPAHPGRRAAVELLKGGEILETLVEAAQREIIETDLPEVIKDAVDQSVEWGATRRPGPGDGFDRLDLDQLAGAVVREAAREVIDAAAPAVSPAQPPAGVWQRLYFAVGQKLRFFATPRPIIADPAAFFRDRYRVGSEDVGRAIPPLVLTETVAHALIVLKNAALGGLDADAHPALGRVTRMLRWLADYPLRIVYWLTGLVRRQPGLGALHVTVTLLGLVLLTIGWRWRHAIWWVKSDDGRRLDRLWTVVFVVLPLVALAAQAIVFSWRERRDRARTVVHRTRVVAGVAAAGLILYGMITGHYASIWTWGNSSLASLTAIVRGPSRLWIAVPLALLLVVWLLRKLPLPRRS